MMTNLSDFIAGLLGGRSGALSSLLPGDMPGDPIYRRPSGYDPGAARWAQISRGLLEAGARIAAAPRGQAVGQGLRGFIEGSDAGKANYEGDLERIAPSHAMEDPAVDGARPSGDAALTEETIDRMPLADLLTIDPAPLTAAQYRALSRRLFREGY
jgi:hypothetical protein